MQCKHCGADTDGEAKFCDDCGQPLQDANSDTSANLTQSSMAVAAKPVRAFVQTVRAALVTDDRPFKRSSYSKKWTNTTTAISHWNQLIRGLDVSPLDFYRSVRTALESRKVPDISLALVEIPEGGVLSAKREYLRVSRKDYAFDICAAPFGDGFFVSSWLGAKPSGFLRLILVIPVIGLIYFKWFRPDTYYRSDTASMFRTSVQNTVLEVLDRMMEAKGIRALSEDERKPVHRDLFRK